MVTLQLGCVWKRARKHVTTVTIPRNNFDKFSIQIRPKKEAANDFYVLQESPEKKLNAMSKGRGKKMVKFRTWS